MISVVIPAYNAETYLADTLRSIQIQSEHRFEVIVVDDGSSDRTRKVVKHFTRNDPRFRYVFQTNAGAGSARNNGFAKCTGKYVTFMDADDLLTPDALEHLLWHAEKYGVDITIGAKRKIQSRSRDFLPKLFAERIKSAAPNKIPGLRYHIAPHAKFFRRDFLLENEISFIEGYTYEDFLHTTQVFTKAKRVGIVPHLCYYYIVRGTSISTSGARPFNVRSRIKVETEIWDYLENLQPGSAMFRRPKNTTFRHRLIRHLKAIRDPSNPDHLESFEILKEFCEENRDYIHANTFGLAFHFYSALLNNDLENFVLFKRGLDEPINYIETQGTRHLTRDFLKRFNVSTEKNGVINP